MREPRPHRRPLSADEAAGALRKDVKAGRRDAEAVEAVLGAAGHRVARRREGPAGLTRREVEVLTLLAQGMSSKETARRLVISPKTVANHVEHIYAKIGASNRGDGEPVRDAARTAPRGAVRARRRAHAVCIASALRAIVSATARRSSLGLNWTYSVPAWTIGTWPGGR